MRLFAFGLGYSARRLIARAGGVEASGTVALARGRRGAARARASRPICSTARAGDAGLAGRSRAPRPSVVSTPPGPDGDPALARIRGRNRRRAAT